VVGVVEMKVETCRTSSSVIILAVMGVPLEPIVWLSSLFFFCSALLLLRLSAFISSRGEGWHRYRLLRSKGFDSCGLLIRRHRNRNAALASCAIVGNFYLTISSLICLLSSRIPSHSKGKKLRSTFPFFVFLPSLSIALLPPPPSIFQLKPPENGAVYLSKNCRGK
jgi:hypothetical protein